MPQTWHDMCNEWLSHKDAAWPKRQRKNRDRMKPEQNVSLPLYGQFINPVKQATNFCLRLKKFSLYHCIQSTNIHNTQGKTRSPSLAARSQQIFINERQVARYWQTNHAAKTLLSNFWVASSARPCASFASNM